MAMAADFQAYSNALLSLVRNACGLPQNRVMIARPNMPNAQRPSRPFATIAWRAVGTQIGQDWAKVEQGEEYTQVYRGTRAMNVEFEFFHDTPEQAFALASTLQASLRAEAFTAPLFEAGLSVWGKQPVMDLSALLNTAYEGRAMIAVQMSYSTRLAIVSDYIEHVSAVGTIDADGKENTITFTANLQEGR